MPVRESIQCLLLFFKGKLAIANQLKQAKEEAKMTVSELKYLMVAYELSAKMKI